MRHSWRPAVRRTTLRENQISRALKQGTVSRSTFALEQTLSILLRDISLGAQPVRLSVTLIDEVKEHFALPSNFAFGNGIGLSLGYLIMSFARVRDHEGRLVIVGLTYNETVELDGFDYASPIDHAGNITWLFEGKPETRSEQRWLYLYEKHRLAMSLRRLDRLR